MEEETCSKLQQSIQQLEAQISQTQLLLDKEKAKYQGAWRQQEVSLQAKRSSTFFNQQHWFSQDGGSNCLVWTHPINIQGTH